MPRQRGANGRAERQGPQPSKKAYQRDGLTTPQGIDYDGQRTILQSVPMRQGGSPLLSDW